jgi:hypothetical protein
MTKTDRQVAPKHVGISQSLANFQHLTKGNLLSQTLSKGEFTMTGKRSVSKEKKIDRLIKKNLKK